MSRPTAARCPIAAVVPPASERSWFATGLAAAIMGEQRRPEVGTPTYVVAVAICDKLNAASLLV
jgi:hypothetical protein